MATQPAATLRVESAALTPRQDQVLRMRAAGLTNDEVAHRLGIGSQNVKNHVSQAYRRLDVTDLVHAMHAKGWVCIR